MPVFLCLTPCCRCFFLPFFWLVHPYTALTHTPYGIDI
jgi:hypothetical protein